MDQPWVYIVLFGLVFIIYAKIMPTTHSAKGQMSPTLHEIEEAMEHFTAELDEQNKALVQRMAETKRENELQTAQFISRLEAVETRAAQTDQELGKLSNAFGELQQKTAYSTETASQIELMNTSAQETDLEIVETPIAMNLKTRYAEMFSLFDQGKSVEYIAKKLNMNKGEVNLIFQLAKQEGLNVH